MGKVLLICNKCSGKAYVEKYINKMTKQLKKQCFEVDIMNTEIDFGADKIIENYNKEVDFFIICGGDGTLSQSINGIIKNGKEIPILYIPFGTTNDFARTLKLSKNKIKCIKNINKYQTKKIDIGKFASKYFYYIAVFGMLSDISYTTPQKEKNMYGRLAYYKQALKESKTRTIYNVRIECEGRIIEDEIMYGSISNSTSIAGFRWFKDEEAKLDDGKFEVILIKKVNNIFELIMAFLALVFKSKNEKYLYCFQTPYLKISCDKEIDWTLDGECGGKSKNVEIYNKNKTVSFMVPKN